MTIVIPRHRNLEPPSGVPYEQAFTQTELLDRGWTVSMIRRHLGKPNAVIRAGFAKYQFDTRTVYKAEATPTFQLDLLSTSDVRDVGPRWLRYLKSYVPAMMSAALEGKAETAETPAESAAWLSLIAELPESYIGHWSKPVNN
jgi:hypothetical protein